MPNQTCLVLICAVLCPVLSGQAAEMRTLPGHVPQTVARLQPLSRVSAANRLHLAISLPLRNQDALTNLLQRLYDPASPDYHHYLTPEQFSDNFGPTDADYQKVIQFAQASGLEVAATRSSRMLLDLQGKAADVEKAFHVTLHNYQHPTEPRQFYAPDVEPSVDASLPILNISGLSDYARMRPMLHRMSQEATAIPAAGSGPGGSYMGKDFSNAYLPGVPLTGSGQTVGLVEFDSYYTNDITNYEALAGLPDVPLQKVLIDGFSGTPGPDNSEVALDIEMTISMAPGLTAVVLFEAPQTQSDWLDLFDSMASSNQIKQFSSSWGYAYNQGSDPNTSFDAEFQKMATQGQSFFQASGDGDAWVNRIWVPADSPYVTSVGGTLLAMSGSGLSYDSETVWNSGNLGVGDEWPANGNGYWGSGGGVSTVYPIPSWQQTVSMTANGGSTNWRNIPDVALTADNVWVVCNNGEAESFMGTSCAAPLWAGFIALVNQQAATNGGTNVGFINPAIYKLGQGPNYASCFHDITTGNNTNAQSQNLYAAVSGYDLCTGWGTPAGSGLIDALAPLNAVAPQLVQNGEFQTGSFSGWTLSGNASGNLFVSTGTAYAYNTTYGVQAGPAGSLGFLSQTLPTVPGQLYLVSFWFDSDGNNAFPNQFSVTWNGSALFNQTNIPDTGWTNLQFTVAATLTNTVLRFGFLNDPAYFGLDDVSVLPLRPVLQNAAVAGGTITFSWSALPGSIYQIQSTTNLSQTTWSNSGGTITASSYIMTATNALGANPRQFYRVVLVP
jgi:subtilase family serine protease